MTTLTRLEDLLRESPEQAQAIYRQLKTLRQRLEKENNYPHSQQEYKQNTLLLEAVIQAEYVINAVYYRYHNRSLIDDGFPINQK